MKISIVKPDSIVMINGEPFEVDLSFLPDNVWAIQVRDGTAEVEYTDSPNCSEVPQSWIDQAIAAWNQSKLSHDAAEEAAEVAWLNSWDRIRSERDALIAQTDWMILPDSPLSFLQRDAIVTYRQALRDVPQDFNSPTEVVWPVIPF